MDAADAAAAAAGKHKSRRGDGAKDPAPGAASWGDMLLGYTKEKLVAPPAGPPQRVTHRDVDYGQAKLDPIRQVYADPEEDQRKARAEAEALQKKTALGMGVSHQYETPYNILNFQSKRPGGDAEQGGARGNRGGWGSGVPYNILNGYSHSVEAEAELRKKEEEELNRTSKRVTGESTTAQRGDFNIINNRYHQGHNDRCKSELDATKQQALDKFYHARSYDPLTGHYYDKLAQERAERLVLGCWEQGWCGGVADSASIANSATSTRPSRPRLRSRTAGSRRMPRTGSGAGTTSPTTWCATTGRFPSGRQRTPSRTSACRSLRRMGSGQRPKRPPRSRPSAR